MVWIESFPLPPSVNNYLMPVAGKVKFSQKRQKHYRQGHLVKTKEHKQYETDCTLWALQHQETLERIKERIFFAMKKSEAAGDRFALKVDTYFVFHETRLFTVNNKIERLDRDNRLKPFQDNIKHIIGLDDKYIFSGNVEKVSTKDWSKECVIIKIAVTRPRTDLEIIKMMEAETSRSP